QELALVAASSLTIGSVSGPASSIMTIAAPLDLNVNSLNLRSPGAILQNAGAPIRLTRTNANGTRIGNLDVRTGNGRISMTAPNEVPGTISFSAQGTASDFDFVNALPTRFQSVVNFGVSGKVRLGSAPFVPPPPETETGLDLSDLFNQVRRRAEADLLAATDSIKRINDVLDANGAEDRKKAEDEKKKQA